MTAPGTALTRLHFRGKFKGARAGSGRLKEKEGFNAEVAKNAEFTERKGPLPRLSELVEGASWGTGSVLLPPPAVVFFDAECGSD